MTRTLGPKPRSRCKGLRPKHIYTLEPFSSQAYVHAFGFWGVWHLVRTPKFDEPPKGPRLTQLESLPRGILCPDELHSKQQFPATLPPASVLMGWNPKL